VPLSRVRQQLIKLLNPIADTLGTDSGATYATYLLFRVLTELRPGPDGELCVRRMFAKQAFLPPADAMKDASLLDDYDFRPTGQNQREFAFDHEPRVEPRTLQRRIRERKERTPGTDHDQMRKELEEMREELKHRAEVGKEAKAALLKIRPHATDKELDAAAGKAIQEMFPPE
jgi:hypothetical protein